MSHNPERRAFRGRSYKKHGEPIERLREADRLRSNIEQFRPQGAVAANIVRLLEHELAKLEGT